MKTVIRWAAALLIGSWGVGPRAFGNGGPFVVKDPHGDPAAKGVLARLDPTLKPAMETRLRVSKEDLTIAFVPEPSKWASELLRLPPVAEVTAAYQIENPTDKEVAMDFGFPILRGIYLRSGMVPYPDVAVALDKERVYPTIISNSSIYGIIRRSARATIELQGVAADPELRRLTGAVRAAWIKPAPPKPKASEKPNVNSSDLDIPWAPTRPGGTLAGELPRKPTADLVPAREHLRRYLTDRLHWNPRDAALLVEYASLDAGEDAVSATHDNWHSEILYWPSQDELTKLKMACLGPLSAIGEQKATQLFAQLASRFDKNAGTAYEAIFSAWGGDVRERSIDLLTGKIRPRELALAPPVATVPDKDPPPEYYDQRLSADPTVYARIDYLDPNAKITKEEKESCRAILKNLPVVFTFAPMNLLYYQAKFAPHRRRAVTVRYRQYAYADTRGAGSYQLAYVLHPATLWKEFGPIQIKLRVPTGIACRASAAVQPSDEVRADRGFTEEELDEDGAAPAFREPVSGETYRATVYRATLIKPEEKTGELFVGVDKPAWDKMFPPKKPETASPVPQGPSD